MPRPKVNAPLNVFVNGRPYSSAICCRTANRYAGVSARPVRTPTACSWFSDTTAPGALQFLPEDIDPGPAGKIEGKLISDDEVAHIAKKKYRLCRRWWMP